MSKKNMRLAQLETSKKRGGTEGDGGLRINSLDFSSFADKKIRLSSNFVH